MLGKSACNVSFVSSSATLTIFLFRFLFPIDRVKIQKSSLPVFSTNYRDATSPRCCVIIGARLCFELRAANEHSIRLLKFRKQISAFHAEEPRNIDTTARSEFSGERGILSKFAGVRAKSNCPTSGAASIIRAIPKPKLTQPGSKCKRVRS